jgi:hypothetical protein
MFTLSKDDNKAPNNIKQCYTNACNKIVWQITEFQELYDQVGDSDDRKDVGTQPTRKVCRNRGRDDMMDTTVEIEIRITSKSVVLVFRITGRRLSLLTSEQKIMDISTCTRYTLKPID